MAVQVGKLMNDLTKTSVRFQLISHSHLKINKFKIEKTIMIGSSKITVKQEFHHLFNKVIKESKGINTEEL